MNSQKIAISIPGELAARARDAVRKGRARTVSAYIAAALEEKSKLDELGELLDEMLAETGGPLSERERKVADAALGQSGRQAKKENAPVSGLTLDSGALIAFERNDRAVVAIVSRSLKLGLRLSVPAGVVGQTWRDGRRQARLARLLGSDLIEIEPMDDKRARAAGQLCGVTHTNDVIDASVVLCARAHGDGVLTSDVNDLRRLDSSLRYIAV